MVILFNNRLVERQEVVVDIEDRGYQFGDGVYEVIRVYNGLCFELDAHLDRLGKSLSALRIQWQDKGVGIKTQIQKLIQLNGLENGIIYLQITRGNAPRVHRFPSESHPILVAYTKELKRPLEDLEKGIRVCLTEDDRWLNCYIKSLNLLGNVLAKQIAAERNCHEALFQRDGVVTEGSSSNCFLVEGRTLVTHPANRFILNGITRMWVIRTARELGFGVEERSFQVEDLCQADEAFLSSTTQEITPIIEVDDIKIGLGKPGVVTRQLQQAFAQAINGLK